jgi:serine/threonine protein kinase
VTGEGNIVMSEETGQLNDMVRRFEAACSDGAGANLEEFLPPTDDPRRLAALRELLPVDLEAQWRRGHEVRLEEYLGRFPELGTARTVAAALIVAEFRARTLHGDRPALEVYRRRFPDQYPECERLARAAALREPETQAHASDALHTPAASPAATPTPPVGAPGEASASPADGKRCGDYRLLDKLGSGGFAEVWQAKAPGDIPVAVKKLFRPMDHEEAQRELKAFDTVKLLSHPYLLQTHRVWLEDGKLCVAMELAEGSLRDRLKQCRRQGLTGIPVDELLRYFREAAEALDYLHSEKVQHRDIKPDNILVLRGHAKVADFGLARFQEKERSMTVTGSGTPAYMPPEAWAGKLHTNSDQYSLAVAYVELRRDRRPFAGASPAELMMAHLQTAPDLEPLAPAEQRVVLRALSREPADRFASCSEFVRALEAARPGEMEPPRTRQSIADPPSLPERGERPGPFEMSGDPTDESLGAPAWRKARAASLPDTAGPTPRLTNWRSAGKGRGGALPVVLLLIAIIPLLGLVVVLADRYFRRPPAAVVERSDAVDFLPPHFEKADGAQVVTEGGKRFYDRIQRALPGLPPVLFVLIPRNPPDQPRGEEIGAFYIMADKVTYELFEKYAREAKRHPENGTWAESKWKGRHPVLGVIAVDAFHCAQWLGGNLPKVVQWDKAAGLDRAPPHGNGGLWPLPYSVGPFLAPWDKKDRKQIAVNRLPEDGPMEVGEATRDQTWSGCRDMAGDGLELTRDLWSGEEVPLEDRPPGKEDRVVVRSQRYTDDRPLHFRDLEEQDQLQSVPYNTPDRETGFRAVIEIPGG